MHLFQRPAALFTLVLFTSIAQADMPIVDDDGIGKNLRVAWSPDMDGGVDGDEADGFEIGFGSEVYPLDQMLVSYAYENRADEENHQVLIGVEDYYPLSDFLKPYGIFGIGYRRIDPEAMGATRVDGWFAKVGVGLLLQPGGPFSLYGEVAYLAGEEQLWQDGGDYASHNLTALLGIRFSY